MLDTLLATDTHRAATRGRSRSRLRRALPIYLFLLPGIGLYALWMLYPLATALFMSFFDWQLARPSPFVGFENYARAFADPLFWRALVNSAGYTLVTVAGQLVLGLGVALLLHERLPLRSFLRLIYYLPVITSWVVVSLIFVYLYNGQSGALNWLLVDVLGLLQKDVAWLAEPATALWAVAALGIWKGVGWTMVVFLAGLQGVPQELYEAAAIDGAGRWPRFRHITLPSIARTTGFLLVALTLGGLSVFVSIFVMTQGGPLNSSEVLLTYMYKQAFERLDLGYGAALAYIFAAVFFVIALVELWFVRRRLT